MRGGYIPAEIDKHYDYYLLIYWTVYIGKLNKHYEVWDNLAKQNNKVKIKVINVNLDCQQYWDAKDKDTVMKILSKKNKN